jgi:hypothetical protein
MSTNCLAALIAALMWTESNGNDKAVGDGGRAWGCLQIRAEVIEDVNRVYGLDYQKEDAFDADKAREICRMYLLYWGDALKCSSARDYARIWNGGPNGRHKPQTAVYWRKVKQRYELAVYEAERARAEEIERFRIELASNTRYQLQPLTTL